MFFSLKYTVMWPQGCPGDAKNGVTMGTEECLEMARINFSHGRPDGKLSPDLKPGKVWKTSLTKLP